MRNALFADSVHFVDFQRSLGIATNILTARLEHLIASGVMEKYLTDDGSGYRLTKRGRDLVPALIALTEWGDRWAAPEGEPVLYRHHAGDHPVHVRVVCELCGPLDDLDDIETLPGPGMPDVLAERLLERHNARHAV